MSDSVPFSTVAKGSNSGIEEPMNKAIQTSSEFDAFWNSHTSISSPPDDIPAINFGMEMVLCVFRGTQKSGGYGVEIKAVENRGDEVVVSCETRDPSPNGIVTQALTQPYHIVRAPKSPKNVRFECAAAKPPPQPFPKFILTFKKDRDPAAIVKTIEGLDAVEKVKYLSGVKIAFVDFDSTKIDKFDAASLLQGLDGVASVEAEPPMDGSQGGEMGF